MLPVMRADIPTVVQSTWGEVDVDHTVLDNDIEQEKQRAGHVLAISLMRNMAVMNVYEPGMQEQHGRVRTLATALDKDGVNLTDVESGGVDSQVFLVDDKNRQKAEQAVRSKLASGGNVRFLDGEHSFITLVGYQIGSRAIDNIVRFSTVPELVTKKMAGV